MSSQPSFVPRQGELVLWCEEIDGEIRQDPSTGEFRIFNLETRAFTEYPRWMGGVVTEVPIFQQAISFEDIQRETPKAYSVSSSGFRIQWYDGPNATNKDFSNRYKYVPMHHIRPLAFWQEYMAGIPKENWHPTVKNCLEAMGALSSIYSYQLNSETPVTKIYSKGYFLGAEAFFAGDTVRLSVNRKCNVTHVLKIDTIETKIEKIENSEGDPLPGENSHRISVEFHGSAFTNEPTGSLFCISIDPIFLDPVMQGYGPWYAVGTLNGMDTVHHSQIIGRLFEKQAMDLWSPKCRSTALDMGHKGVLEAREWSKKVERRVKPGEGSYVADARVESLNLEKYNGADVGVPDPNIDPRLQQEFFAALDGSENEEGHSQVEDQNEGGHSLAEAENEADHSQVKVENAEEHSQAEIDPKHDPTTSALSQDSEDSSKDSQQDAEEVLEQGMAGWNKKRAHPTSSSSDEFQGPPSARKCRKSFNMEF